MNKPYIIVLGNEKGGTGKSTTAMHILTALMHMGYKVGSIDLDARQGSLSKYIDHRKRTNDREDITLKIPTHKAIFTSELDSKKDSFEKESEELESALVEFSDRNFIIMDTPGNNSAIARKAHSYADTLITPLNDSFIDLDVLAHINPDTLEMESPSIYANGVWEQKKEKAIRSKESIDWIILRNRLSQVHAHNKKRMEAALKMLAKRLSFKVVPGFSERVIFRELFSQGMTLLDLEKVNVQLTLSHIAAKQELRSLMENINLPELQTALSKKFI